MNAAQEPLSTRISSTYLSSEKKFEHEDHGGITPPVGTISTAEYLRDTDKESRHGTLADVVEEADVAVRRDQERRQCVEERVVLPQSQALQAA